MRVLVVVHRFPPQGVTGVERYTEALVGELAAAGDEVTVVAAAPADDASQPHARTEPLPGGGTVHRLLGPVADAHRFLVHHQGFERLFEPILAEAAPEVVHVNHVLHLSPRFVHAAGRSGAAIVVSVHDYYFECALYQLRTPSGELCGGPAGGSACARTCFAGEGLLAASRWAGRTAYFRRLLDLADRVHSPSAHVASRLERQLAEPHRLRTLALGIRSGKPERRAITEHPFRVAFAGKLSPPKGVDVVLEALAVARLPEAELVVLGPAADEAYAAQLRARAGQIAGLRYETPGKYEPSELPRLLAGADCLVVPSVWPETYSLVAREALALGIPAVVSRLGALPEAVRDGVNGFTYQHDRPDELAAILRRLSAEPELLGRLRAGAEATPMPGLREHAHAMRSLYAEALADPLPGRAERIDELEVLFGRLLELGFADRRLAA